MERNIRVYNRILLYCDGAKRNSGIFNIKKIFLKRMKKYYVN